MNWTNFVITPTYYLGASSCQPSMYQMVPHLQCNEQSYNQFQIFVLQKTQLVPDFTTSDVNAFYKPSIQADQDGAEDQAAKLSKRNRKISEDKEKRDERQRKSARSQARIKEHSCQCKMSSCIKQYCFCFKNGEGCNQKCSCVSCRNMEGRHKNFQKVKRVKTIMCNCSKSECSKKYCECFAAGKKCGQLCNCTNCQN